MSHVIAHCSHVNVHCSHANFPQQRTNVVYYNHTFEGMVLLYVFPSSLITLMWIKIILRSQGWVKVSLLKVHLNINGYLNICLVPTITSQHRWYLFVSNKNRGFVKPNIVLIFTSYHAWLVAIVLGPLHTRAKSRDHEIVRAQKKVSKGHPNTPRNSHSVVTDPQVQCEVICDRTLNQVPFQWISIHVGPHTW